MLSAHCLLSTEAVPPTEAVFPIARLADRRAIRGGLLNGSCRVLPYFLPLVLQGALLGVLLALTLGSDTAVAQFEQLELREGMGVPVEVKSIYNKAADFLAASQKADGSWSQGGNFHGNEACGVCGLATMAFLSTGEDPNFGRYARNIRRSIRFIISKQKNNGYIPGNMYVHGFAMLALAEAYGAVDDEMLWAGEPRRQRTIGEALELAVRLAVTSQKKNTAKGWRYSPNENSADTSVVGAVLMGLLAARNAGIPVPDDSIDGALKYMKSMTEAESGMVGYSGLSGFGDSTARTGIACLVFSIGKRNDWPELAGVRKYLVDRVGTTMGQSWPFYERYYVAQALFQADYEAWQKWNRQTIDEIRGTQRQDGQIGTSAHGPAYSTSMSLLALALNYRFLPIYER